MMKNSVKNVRFIWFALGISMLIALIIGFDGLPILRGGEIFNWQWGYQPIGLERILIFALIVTAYSAIALQLARIEKHRLMLWWSFAGVVIVTLAATWARAGNPLLELYYRTVSLTATGPYSASALIDWSSGNWLQWTSTMQEYEQLSQHVALSPPLLPLLQRWATQLIDAMPLLENSLQQTLLPYQCNNYTVLSFTPAEQAAAIIGILMPVWAALAVFPLYGIQKRITQIKAPYLSAVWALIPALVMFGGSWNTLYPTIGLLSFWLLLKGSDEHLKIHWLILSGLLMGVLTFANFSVVPLAMFFGFYTLLHYIINERQQHHFSRPVLIGAWFGVGVALVWVIFMLMGGSSPIAMLRTAFALHLELDRPYIPWLWMHFWEWILLGSIPFTILWLYSLKPTGQRWHIVSIALVCTMGIMLMSNTARGETGRVWLFFVPFILIGAATLRPTQRGWMALFAAQGLMLIALVSTWNVMVAPDVKAPPSAPQTIADAIPINAQFGDAFTLVAWRGVQNSDTIQLDFVWEAQQFMDTPYYFAALPVSPSGNVTETLVWQPQQTNYPTTCWYNNVQIGDSIAIPLPDDYETGGWYISLTAFADVDNPTVTLPITLPDTTTDRQIGLGAIEVK